MEGCRSFKLQLFKRIFHLIRQRICNKKSFVLPDKKTRQDSIGKYNRK